MIQASRDHLKMQQNYVNRFYDWEVKGHSLDKIFKRSNKCKTINQYGFEKKKTARDTYQTDKNRKGRIKRNYEINIRTNQKQNNGLYSMS